MINVNIQSPNSIQYYLNQALLNGGGEVLLDIGTYKLYADLYIPSGVTLKGTSRDNCIIDCNSDYSVRIEGSDPYSTGTVTINFGDTTLVGSGTTFTSDMVGQSVMLNGYWYEITDFTDTTHLEIESYEGDNIAGGSFVIATINANSILRTVTVINSTGAGISIKYSDNPNLDDLSIYDNAIGIDIDYCLYPQILSYTAYNDVNLDMNYVEGVFINFCDFSFSNSGSGIVMTKTNNGLIFNSNISNNTTSGISMTDCDNNLIQSVFLRKNGTYGAIITNSGCNDNLISLNVFSSNSSGAVSDTGTGTLIRSNIGVADN